MRGIKFRAWDVNKKVMTSVAGIWLGDDGSALTITFEPAPKSKFYHGLVNGENGILMQFTGLKDPSGREIYEGDLMQDPMTNTVCCVKWCEKSCMFYMDHPDAKAAWPISVIWKIVGNIYENPELK